MKNRERKREREKLVTCTEPRMDEKSIEAKLTGVEIAVTVYPRHVWWLIKHADPQKWGRLGWAFLMGLSWWVDTHDPASIKGQFLYATWCRLVTHQSALLMCIFCSRHFQKRLIDHPLSPTHTRSCLQWMHGAWSAVSMRALDSKDETETELLLRGRTTTFDAWKAYYSKRIGNETYRTLWYTDCLVFLTVMLRCLPPPHLWDVNLRAHVYTYFSAVSSLLELAVQNWVQVALTIEAWSTAWHACVLKRLNTSQSANAVYTLAMNAFVYYAND